MKMNYRLIHSAKNTAVGAKWTAPLIVAFVIAFFYFFYPSLLQSGVHVVLRPILRVRAFSVSTVSDAISYFISMNALIAERDELSFRLRIAEALLADRDLRVEENALLKETLNRASVGKKILSAVLASPPLSPYDTLVLDAGETNGVAIGDEVMSGATAIGTIKKVFLRTSIADLFSTSGRITSVSILHEGRVISAEAEGYGGGMFKIILPKDIGISVGDQVILPRITPVFLGVIDNTQKHTADSFQTLYFRSVVPMSRDLFVTIIPRISDENI